MAKDEEKNPEEVIDQFIVETTGALRLLDMEELIIATTYLNIKCECFSSEELVRTFSRAMASGDSETISLTSMFMEKYKDKIQEDTKIDDSNVDEAIRHLRQDRSKAISMARRS